MAKTLKVKKLRPMFTALITTMNKYTEPTYIPGTGIIDANKVKNGLQEYQTVVEVGDSVRGIKAGDIVCINPDNYAVRKYSKDSMKSEMEEYKNDVVRYNFNVVRMNDEDYLLLDQRDIEFVVTDYEWVEE